MLQPQNRLTRKRDFEILFAEGRYVAAPHVGLKVWKVEPEKYPKRGYTKDDLKIGFVVGLKASKKAVERNRAKRQMREVVRLFLKSGVIKNGYMMSFVATPAIIGASTGEIEKDIIMLLEKARLFV